MDMGTFSRLGLLGEPSFLDLALDYCTPLWVEACQYYFQDF